VNQSKIIIGIFLFVFYNAFAQKSNESKSILLKDTAAFSKKINPLAPARAGFYSAILPGLGQAYNKKYWKIPLVYGALGAGVYLYVNNNRQFDKFRAEYRSRLAGNDRIDFSQFSTETLITGQRVFKRNRDLSLLFCVAMYALNIVDANVDAHLMQFNVNDNLSFKPDLIINPTDFRQSGGISMKLSF
jgi:hypothetical protein